MPRRFEKNRKTIPEKQAQQSKQSSTLEWGSESDPHARIVKMKDGRTHRKYKAENAIDLDTEIIVAAEIYHGDCGDAFTIEDTVNAAQTHLNEAATDCEIEEVVADKGRRSEESLGRAA